MVYELFTFSGTPFGWRVQLAAAMKEVPLEIHWLQPTQDILKDPEFLGLNPRGKVPALRADGFAVYESSAIVSYLDARNPEPPLFGKSAEEDGLTRQVISEIDCYLSRHIPAFAVSFFTDSAKDMWDVVVTTADACYLEFEHYEARLKSSAFVVLNQVSAADVMLYPLIAVFLRAASKPDAASLGILASFAERFPNIHEWMARIEAIPNFESTVPPGWD